MFDLDTDWLPAANNGVREDEEDESTTESEDCPGDGRDTADFNEEPASPKRSARRVGYRRWSMEP
ncbi:unnamed protein product [Pylaiella littoralis]